MQGLRRESVAEPEHAATIRLGRNAVELACASPTGLPLEMEITFRGVVALAEPNTFELDQYTPCNAASRRFLPGGAWAGCASRPGSHRDRDTRSFALADTPLSSCGTAIRLPSKSLLF